MDNEGLKPPEVRPGVNPAEQSGAPTAVREGKFWEDKGPFFPRIIRTWTRVMFHPTSFFKSVPTSSEIAKPLLYALIVGSIGMVFAIIWQFLWNMLMAKVSPGSESGFEAFYTVAMLPFILILVPFGVVIGQFVGAGILHLCLMIVGGNKNGFGATFRVVAYGYYSPALLQVIPLCGAIVAGVWSIVLEIIGLKETHQISTGKAVLAVFLPLIFGCGCLLILIFAIGGGALFFAARKG